MLFNFSKNSRSQKNLVNAIRYANDVIFWLQRGEFPNKVPFCGELRIAEAFNTTIEGLHTGDIRIKDALQHFYEYRDEIRANLEKF